MIEIQYFEVQLNSNDSLTNHNNEKEGIKKKEKEIHRKIKG